MMKAICQERLKTTRNAKSTVRGASSVASDLEKLLGSKNLEELEKLEQQIRSKLSSDEPVDTDYWEHLLSSLLAYKARAKLRKVSQSILEARLRDLRKQQAAEATVLKSRFQTMLDNQTDTTRRDGNGQLQTGSGEEDRYVLDPEPLLRLRSEDKSLDAVSEKEFSAMLTESRRKVSKMRFVPDQRGLGDSSASYGLEPALKRARIETGDQPFETYFEREVARRLGENSELFVQEEEVVTKNKSQWEHLHRPRKPKYFNRVQLGYEWNKYNQTHYDHDNPPPKVVQGYKFNVFYPDLVDKTKAPTYRIERENGRRRGQTLAPAGEDDACLIRFVAGAPYEDVAFRIVDKEWDYSAKRERGFRSSFDKVRLVRRSRFMSLLLACDWAQFLLCSLTACMRVPLGPVRFRPRTNISRRAFSNYIFSSRK